ncbi:MAG TPA: hypothetical protein PKC10_08995 [Cyclobacteriaceae bacterium]|nr:hypothetical protein [Cyclobacteriaceae bacterium]
MKIRLTLALVFISVWCVAQDPTTKEEKSKETEPMIVVDGVKYLRSDSTHVLKKLNPEKIKAIKVLRGQEAIDLYGEEGKAGVILVTTKTPVTKPLYFLDGKRVEDLSSVNPHDIQSIEVIKDQNQLLPFGDEGKQGVIKITMKPKNRFQ